MFESELVGAESFKISVENDQCIVTAVNYDKTEKILHPIWKKEYLEGDTISKMEWLKFGGKVAKAVGGIGNGIHGVSKIIEFVD